MRAIFNMGIPVAPKNIFPSNIEGLPTWFQIRVSPEGYMARKGDPDVLVALNPATWAAAQKGVPPWAAHRTGSGPGAAVVHDAAYSTAGARDDVFYYPVPFTQRARTKIDSDK